MLKTEGVRPITLRVKFNDGASQKEWECHLWTTGTGYVDLFRVEDGKLIQFAALTNVSRVEEIAR